ncbi:MAG: O-antigen ligase family protein [Candidatus Hodarchaeales archaeon]|jgi:hypothetical protein
MQQINSQSTTQYFVVGAIIFTFICLMIVLQKPIILSLLLIMGIICFLFYMLLPDRWVIYIVFISYIFYLDFLFKGHDLFEAVLPISFFVLLIRRLLKKDLNLLFIWSKAWPFLLYFAIGFYWFTQRGMAPTVITGKDVFGMGNFSHYYNIFLNMLTILLPFIVTIEVEDLVRFLKVLLFLFILKAIFLVVHVISGSSFYFPGFLPYFSAHLRDLSGSGAFRIGAISGISYSIILYIVFWSDNFQKHLKWIIILFALCINIIWGGGRADLICSIFILIFVSIIRSQKFYFGEVLKSVAKFATLTAVILISFNVLAKYIAPNQQERFAEIVNLKNAYEKRIDGDNTRPEMWRYAVEEGLKKPLLGNGVSQYFDYEKYQRAAYGLVATGGAHNKYISIFYSFGLIGLTLFLWGSKNFFSKLFYLKKWQPYVLWDFLLMHFIVVYLIRFNLGGGISSQYFIFYFFVGYLLSYQARKAGVD